MEIVIYDLEILDSSTFSRFAAWPLEPRKVICAERLHLQQLMQALLELKVILHLALKTMKGNLWKFNTLRWNFKS